jgi:hypothetical protein
MLGFHESIIRLINTGAVSSFVVMSFVAGWGQRQEAPSKPHLVPGWKTFTSKGGWQIQYPPNWKISSCTQCSDLRAANIYVVFSAPSSDEYVWIEQLADKPFSQGVAKWLNYLGGTGSSNGNHEEAISFAGRTALSVHDRETEKIYVVNNSKSYAIRTSNPHGRDEVRRILMTFKFTRR